MRLLVLGHDVGDDGADAELFGYGAGGDGVVAGEHVGLYAEFGKAAHGLGAAVFYRVGRGYHAGVAAAAGEVQRGLALGGELFALGLGHFYAVFRA